MYANKVSYSLLLSCLVWTERTTRSIALFTLSIWNDWEKLSCFIEEPGSAFAHDWISIDLAGQTRQGYWNLFFAVLTYNIKWRTLTAIPRHRATALLPWGSTPGVVNRLKGLVREVCDPQWVYCGISTFHPARPYRNNSPASVLLFQWDPKGLMQGEDS